MPLHWINPPDSTSANLSTITGHRQAIEHLAISQDGKRILSMSLDQTIRIWDFTTGNQSQTIGTEKTSPHVEDIEGSLDRLARRPTPFAVNQELATLFRLKPNGDIEAMDVSNEIELYSVQAEDQKISVLALSPDSRYLISGSIQGTISVWDTRTQKLLRCWRAHQLPITCLSFSSDGSRVYSGGFDKIVRVWDPESTKELLSIGQTQTPGVFGSYNPLGTLIKKQGIVGWVNVLAVTPDGKRVFVGDGVIEKIKTWDGLTGRTMESLSGHDGWINDLTVSPDGRLLASASQDNTIKIWDVDESREIAALMGHAGSVTALAFSPDAKFIVSGSVDCTINIWDVRAAQATPALEERERYVSDVAFFPDGRRLISVGDKVHVWEIATGKKLLSAEPSGKPSVVNTSPDGRSVLWANSDTIVEFWSPQSGAKPLQLNSYLGIIAALAFSPDGTAMVAGGDEYFLRIWEVQSGRDRHLLSWYSAAERKKRVVEQPSPVQQFIRFLEPKEGIAAAAVTLDSRLLVAGGRDGAIKIWDTQSGKSIAAFAAHHGSVSRIALFPDGTHFVSGGQDGMILIWDLDRPGRSHVLEQSTASADRHPIQSLVVASNGDHLYWSTSAGLVWQSDLRIKQSSVMGSIGAKRLSFGRIQNVAVTPDAQYVVAGGASAEIMVWKAGSGEVIDVFRTHAAVRFVDALDNVILALDATGRFYILELSGVDIGPRCVSATKTGRNIQYRCPHCFHTNLPDPRALGHPMNCQACGKTVKVNRSIASGFRAPWWRFW